MFRTGTSSIEYKNEPRTETDNPIPGYSSYQSNESFTTSPSERESLSRPVAESEKIAREIREGSLSGFVGAGATITADVSFKSLLRVDGLISGRITSDEGTLVVGAAGRVDANVTVAIARINGTVTGDIVCSERIEFGAAAKVTGNIQAPTLKIEPGAVLDGRCRMGTQAELETVSEPAATAAQENIAEAEAIAESQVAAGEPSVSGTAIDPPQAPNATKVPKVARKASLRAKPRRARDKVATANTADREEADGEQAAVAAG